MKTSRAPLIVAIVFLLLPVLYVGSYLALVVPGPGTPKLAIDQSYGPFFWDDHYRYGGRWSARLFWPLEQIDRRVRPGAWQLLIPKGYRSPFVPERTITGGALPDSP